MDDDDRLFLGGLLRYGYEVLKTNFKNEKNEDFFDFAETIGSDTRKILEEDPRFKKAYQGADVVRKGKEFWDSVKSIFDND